MPTRLIDANALKQAMKQLKVPNIDSFHSAVNQGISQCIDSLDSAPTVEERESGINTIE